jgi:hypothetical protein
MPERSRAGNLLIALREQPSLRKHRQFGGNPGNLVIELRERSVVRVGPPRQNLLLLLGEDIEDSDLERKYW